jgi:hypothetical protein
MNQWLKFQPKREHVSGFCAKGGERLLPNCYKKEPVIPINIWVCHQQTLTLPENSNDLNGIDSVPIFLRELLRTLLLRARYEIATSNHLLILAPLFFTVSEKSVQV